MKRQPCRLCFGTGHRYELADPGHHALSRATAREEYLVRVPCPACAEDPVVAGESWKSSTGGSSE